MSVPGHDWVFVPYLLGHGTPSGWWYRDHADHWLRRSGEKRWNLVGWRKGASGNRAGTQKVAGPFLTLAAAKVALQILASASGGQQ